MENKKVTAINTQNFIWLFAFALLLGIALICFFDGSAVMGTIFSLFAAMAAFVIIISSGWYVFDDEGVTVCYILGRRERIEWKDVQSVVVFSSWLSKGSGSPHYRIVYDGVPSKFYVNGEIAKTMKTKSLMMQYCGNKIK